jgi:FkbM family methyltransferase
MGDMINYIKKPIPFFQNRVAEFFLLKLIKINYSFFKKIIPSNTNYKKGSFRNVLRDGIQFHLDISDYQQYLIYFDLQENSSKPLLNYIPNKEGVIIDIGANIGQTSLWIAQKFEKSKNIEIHAFEPYPDTFKALEKNIKANSYKNIKIFNIALGSKDDEILMVQDCETNSGGFRVFSEKHNKDKKIIKVKQVTLDLLHEQIKDVFFIKIDVEGYEMEVLKGAVNILSKYKPTLFIELNDINLKQQNSSANELIIFLENLNYSHIKNSETSIEINSKMNLLDCSFDIICK